MSDDRYLSPDPAQRQVARALCAEVQQLCPHGHADPRMLADSDNQWGTPVDLLITPDHYVWRQASTDWLADHVIRGIIDEDDAYEMIVDMAYRLAKQTYKLEGE